MGGAPVGKESGLLWDDLAGAALAAVAQAATESEIEDARIRYLGRKGELTAALREVGQLPPDRKSVV